MKHTMLHLIKGLDPVADAFDGTVYSDIISCRNFKTIAFVIFKGAGAVGTSKITVNASNNIVAGAETAIPFRYQRINPGDTHSTLTKCTAAGGFTTTAGSSEMYIIYVNASDVGATGYEFCRLSAVEVANAEVLGGILAIGLDPRFDREIQETAII